MALRYIDDFDMDHQIAVIEAYLYKGKSHRAIQREILGLPAPARGGGFVAMNILHHFDIRSDKKSILSYKSIEDELITASKRYRKALNLLTSARNYRNRIKETIKQESKNFHLPKMNTEFNQIVKGRIGQNILREIILDNYSNQCAMCKVDINELLICSHIVPWSIDHKNRLNPKNAICLCSWHDSLFDKGFISMKDDYKIITSSRIPDYLKLNLTTTYLRLPKENKPEIAFIRYHRANIFNI